MPLWLFTLCSPILTLQTYRSRNLRYDRSRILAWAPACWAVHPFIQQGKAAKKFREKWGIRYKSVKGCASSWIPRVKYKHGISVPLQILIIWINQRCQSYFVRRCQVRATELTCQRPIWADLTVSKHQSEMKTDTKIDHYIMNAAPSLSQSSSTFANWCIWPAGNGRKDEMELPHFDTSPMVSMAAFKQHCAFTFWKVTCSMIHTRCWIKNAQNRWVIWKADNGGRPAVWWNHDCLIKRPWRSMKPASGCRKSQRLPEKESLSARLVSGHHQVKSKSLRNVGKFQLQHRKEYVEWLRKLNGKNRAERMNKTLICWRGKSETGNTRVSSKFKGQSSKFSLELLV